ncbi:Type IV secretory pathway, VirD4 components [Metamycoplasma arthritidis]|uniref:TraD/TraG TraM recognition site domain-containing protein n=1 Tax=Metamycoplasma arthritidis (strain 158L3-1) TaxID=243272 RepID=B3PMZ3_META1|nr:TraM recognition domain-containing protein [Metamycoplasma arthritidis]ACF07395.1 hypothetical protein MARTH_orf601 [Metamycoplasma arthritidis 158L3-1]VEU78915.1 Type IV secretory pathway, VirD4 components [Metamycoplasma arthritidis]
MLLVIQSFEQLQKYAKKGRNSKARLNCLLETNYLETSKSFSSILGQKLIEHKTISSTNKNETISISEQKEDLMSLSDLKYKTLI